MYMPNVVAKKGSKTISKELYLKEFPKAFLAKAETETFLNQRLKLNSSII